MVFKFDKECTQTDASESDTELNERNTSKGFMQEAVLELAENEKGQIVLRDTNDAEEPLVTIDFSAKVHDVLGSDTQFIGHQMVHAALQAVMQKQVSQWHANVYDEEPENYS